MLIAPMVGLANYFQTCWLMSRAGRALLTHVQIAATAHVRGETLAAGSHILDAIMPGTSLIGRLRQQQLFGVFLAGFCRQRWLIRPPFPSLNIAAQVSKTGLCPLLQTKKRIQSCKVMANPREFSHAAGCDSPSPCASAVHTGTTAVAGMLSSYKVEVFHAPQYVREAGCVRSSQRCCKGIRAWDDHPTTEKGG